MTKIDIIILSNAKNDELKNLTIQTIKTLVESEDPAKIKFEVLVIESNRELESYQFEHATTIYPVEKFGFNKFLNIGIRATTSTYVCLCNNDLIFHKGWATEILKAFNNDPEIDSANPYCQKFVYDERIINGDNIIRRDHNLNINGILTGWCIFVKRSIFKKIGLFDEQFTFWYADNDYDLTLRKHRVKHALVKSSMVTHLACQSHNLLSDKKEEMTIGQKTIFEKKWQRYRALKKIIRLLQPWQ